MKFTPENKSHIENHLYYIRNKYPWLGILLFDKTQLKTKEDLIKHITEKYGKETYEDLKNVLYDLDK